MVLEEITINKSKKNNGFTLIELIVVMAIMSIVVGIIFPISSYGSKLYQMSLNQSYNQQDVRLVSDYIKRELRNANAICLTAGAIPSSNSVYYALTFKTVGTNKYLVKQTFNGQGSPNEQIIGNSLTSLDFLSSANLGMLKVSIDDNTNAKDYAIGFDFLINNFASVSILPQNTDVTTIYYAKN